MYRTREIFNTETETYERLSQYQNSTKIIVVTGNPGVIEFYKQFIDTLFDNLSQKYDIFGVGNAGHTKNTKESKIYSLKEQIEHKISFLKFITDNFGAEDFILIGHSIGSYINLKVQASNKFKIQHMFHLFPTIRDLYQGLNFYVKFLILPPVRYLIANFVHYANFARHAIKQISTEFTSESLYVLEGNVNFNFVQNVLGMARYEALEVVDIDFDCSNCLNSSPKQHTFIYGQTDNYTPLHFISEFSIQFPEIKVILAPKEVKHAFVFQHSTIVANLVSEEMHKMIEVPEKSNDLQTRTTKIELKHPTNNKYINHTFLDVVKSSVQEQEIRKEIKMVQVSEVVTRHTSEYKWEEPRTRAQKRSLSVLPEIEESPPKKIKRETKARSRAPKRISSTQKKDLSSPRKRKKTI